MTYARRQKTQAGFSLLELMIAVVVFVAICGAMFGLLSVTQKRYQTESQVLDSFQEARLGLDQIARDVSSAGYPPLNHFTAGNPPAASYAISPVAWTPNYPAAGGCLIGTAGGGTCTTPNDFDLIIESDYDGTGVVKWIRYRLPAGSTTLWRGFTNKVAGVDPVAATNAAGVMVPYIRNVMNNAPAAQIAQIRAAYPLMFAGGNPQPIFQYICDVPNAPPQPCPTAPAGSNIPANVRDVAIRLIIQAQQRDAQTGVLRLVELNGRGHRVNPNK